MRLVYQLGVSNRLTATPGDAIPLPPKDGSPLAQNLMADQIIILVDAAAPVPAEK